MAVDATLSPERALEWATCTGARALGLAGRAGELCEGGWADLIAIPFAGPVPQAAAAVVAHSGPVMGSLIDGEWAVRPAGVAE